MNIQKNGSCTLRGKFFMDNYCSPNNKSVISWKKDFLVIWWKIFSLNDTWKIFTIVLLGSACGASLKFVSICELFVSKSEHENHFLKSLIFGFSALLYDS